MAAIWWYLSLSPNALSSSVPLKRIHFHIGTELGLALMIITLESVLSPFEYAATDEGRIERGAEGEGRGQEGGDRDIQALPTRRELEINEVAMTGA